ncbi:N-methyl-L-tryptophan oxidase [Conexibacter sp. CPCC 205706]|nr:N-methyl-L-tryptophan oxidase [Conexibacter sp. CPCC 205706]MDO8188494.1 N-methyl-L-tryptophan oxidase [Conexibacter sp. CPCC 205706]
MGDAHHLNAAGAALPSARTLAAVTEQLQLEARIGGYEAAHAVRPRLDGLYALAGNVLGAAADEIALTESATVAWQRAVDALRLGRGDRVLVSRSGYVSCALHLLTLERERGVVVELLPCGEDGALDLDALAASLEAGPAALLVVTHVPTSSGLIEPVAAAGELARLHGVPYLVDATQSAGQLPLDAAAIGADLLVATGRKFLRGPRGTGVLVVRRGLLERLAPTAPDVRGAEWTGERDWTLVDAARRFETWEGSHALRLGLGVALAELDGLGVASVSEHLGAASDRLRGELSALPGVRIADPAGAAGSAIVTFTVDGMPARDVAAQLAVRAVHVVSVPASHGRWDLEPRALPAVVRASIHVYSDDGDLNALRDGVAALARLSVAPRAELAGAASGNGASANGSAAGAGAGAAGAGAAGSARPPAPSYPATPGPPVERVDAVVVGLGAHGSATTRALAERGFKVVALERFRLGHDRGSSHGETRMIRRAYPNPVWDPFVELAYDAWARLEEATGERLLERSGGLFARPVGATDALRGPGCTVLDADAAREVFPAIELGDELEGLYDPAAGLLHADRSLRALQLLARRSGAKLRDAEPLLAWEPDGDGVRVDSVGGRLRADRLIVCGGPWLPSLVPQLGLRQRIARIVNVYLEPRNPALVVPPSLGCFSFDLPIGLVYGIAALRGRGVKIGLDDGREIDPDRPREPATEAELAELAAVAARHLPAAAGPIQSSLTCLYAFTPDKRFVVGPVPDLPQVLVASACSGHGFKFAPALGEALADLVAGTARPDLDFISTTRLEAQPAQ